MGLIYVKLAGLDMWVVNFAPSKQGDSTAPTAPA